MAGRRPAPRRSQVRPARNPLRRVRLARQEARRGQARYLAVRASHPVLWWRADSCLGLVVPDWFRWARLGQVRRRAVVRWSLTSSLPCCLRRPRRHDLLRWPVVRDLPARAARGRSFSCRRCCGGGADCSPCGAVRAHRVPPPAPARIVRPNSVVTGRSTDVLSDTDHPDRWRSHIRSHRWESSTILGMTSPWQAHRRSRCGRPEGGPMVVVPRVHGEEF